MKFHIFAIQSFSCKVTKFQLKNILGWNVSYYIYHSPLNLLVAMSTVKWCRWVIKTLPTFTCTTCNKVYTRKENFDSHFDKEYVRQLGIGLVKNKCYRSISLTSLVMNIFEKCVREKLHNLCIDKITAKQHGFLPEKSCTTQMLVVTFYNWSCN